MLERTNLRFNLELLKTEFQTIIDGLRKDGMRSTGNQVWVDNTIGLSYVSRKVSLCNEDNPYRDINTPASFGFGLTPIELDQFRLARSLEGTETASVLQIVKTVTTNPHTAGRVRYVKVDSLTTQPLRTDIGYTYYIALDAHPLTFFLVNTSDGLPKRVNEGNLPMMRTYSVAEDGYAYLLDGSKYHSIVNTGNAPAYFLAVETNRVHRDKPEWTGLTSEQMTGNKNVLDGDLRNGTIFQSTDL